MKYYRIPAALDQRPVYKRCAGGWTFARHLIGGELYTAKECARYGLRLEALEELEISKRRVYWSFGARFEYMEV